MEIISDSTTEAWKKALKYVFEEGKDFEDNKRICREALNLTIKIKKPEHDITGPIDILNGFKKWVYPPLEEIRNIILSKNLAPVYSYIYGPRIFNYRNKINQIENFVIPLLRETKESRRAVVTLWDPEEDSNVYKKGVPGLISLDFKLRKNRLNVTAIIRSNDLFFGWPANIFQIYSLLEMLTKRLDCLSGSITIFSTSIHIFKDQFEDIKKVLES
jgi:thymidylate synthase (methanogen type)